MASWSFVKPPILPPHPILLPPPLPLPLRRRRLGPCYRLLIWSLRSQRWHQFRLLGLEEQNHWLDLSSPYSLYQGFWTTYGLNEWSRLGPLRHWRLYQRVSSVRWPSLMWRCYLLFWESCWFIQMQPSVQTKKVYRLGQYLSKSGRLACQSR